MVLLQCVIGFLPGFVQLGQSLDLPFVFLELFYLRLAGFRDMGFEFSVVNPLLKRLTHDTLGLMEQILYF